MNAPTDPKLLERSAALQGMGDSRLRKEDARFIQGKGNYVDDIKLPAGVKLVTREATLVTIVPPSGYAEEQKAAAAAAAAAAGGAAAPAAGAAAPARRCRCTEADMDARPTLPAASAACPARSASLLAPASIASSSRAP